MAKATANCTCEICGAKFERTTTKRNCREAENWVAWAEENITICPSCYRESKREAEAQQPLTAEIRYKTATAFGGEPRISFVFYGNTYEVKDQIKAMGGKWSSDYPSEQGALGDILGTRAPEKRWSIDCTADEYDAVLERVQSIAEQISPPTQEQIAMFAELRKAYQANKDKERAEKEAREAAIAEKAAALGAEPQYDADIAEMLEGKRWNGRFYGRAGKWRVYLSGTETPIDDDVKERMETTQAAKAERKKALDGIKGK